VSNKINPDNKNSNKKFWSYIKSKKNDHCDMASGPDGIPTRLLKELAYSIAPILALIFNASLHQGKLPVDWKTATVVPEFKKGSWTDPANCRPISFTCVCCKVFEHIVSSAISNHANIHNIICTEQHGFRKHRSCEKQLLETINNIAMSLNSTIQTDLLLLVGFFKGFWQSVTL